MKAAWIALAMMIACGALAESQPPAPTPTKVDQPPKQQPKSKCPKSDEPSHPPDQHPPSTVFTASPSIYVEAPCQKNDTEKTSAPEWWAISINGCLLIVTFFQLLTFRRQAGIMEAQTRISVDQKNITVDLQRPYVYGRVTKPGLKPIDTPIGPDLMRSMLELCIDNIGTTPASLTRLQWEISTAPRGGIAPAIDLTILGGRELPVGTVAIKGEPFFETEKLALRFIEEKNDIIELKRTVWVVGFVRYVHIFGHHRISGFAHALDLIHERFVRRGGEKYNYARDEDPSQIPPGISV